MVAELKAEVRALVGTRNMNRLRSEGRIPGVIYGGEAQAATALSVDGRELLHVLHLGSRVVSVAFGGRTAQALIKQVQYDHLGEHVLHVDFVELRAGQTVQVEVPVVLKGTAKGTADGGVVTHVLHRIDVECLPAAIPDRIVVEVDQLGKGEAIKVSDLKLPPDVKVLQKAGDVIASCYEVEIEEAAPAAGAAEGAALEPEVLMEKKEEEEAPAAKGAAPAGQKPAADAKKKEGK